VLDDGASADAESALAEAAELVEAYGQKLTDAVDAEALLPVEGEWERGGGGA
jgi:hypothetical protein